MEMQWLSTIINEQRSQVVYRLVQHLRTGQEHRHPIFYCKNNCLYVIHQRSPICLIRLVRVPQHDTLMFLHLHNRYLSTQLEHVFHAFKQAYLPDGRETPGIRQLAIPDPQNWDSPRNIKHVHRQVYSLAHRISQQNLWYYDVRPSHLECELEPHLLYLEHLNTRYPGLRNVLHWRGFSNTSPSIAKRLGFHKTTMLLFQLLLHQTPIYTLFQRPLEEDVDHLRDLYADYIVMPYKNDTDLAWIFHRHPDGSYRSMSLSSLISALKKDTYPEAAAYFLHDLFRSRHQRGPLPVPDRPVRVKPSFYPHKNCVVWEWKCRLCETIHYVVTENELEPPREVDACQFITTEPVRLRVTGDPNRLKDTAYKVRLLAALDT